MQTSNFDMDVTGTPGGGASASILDVSGVTTNLVLSGDAVHAENTVVVEPTAVSTPSPPTTGCSRSTTTPAASGTGSSGGRRTSRAGSDNPPNAPRNPNNPLRMYLPNRIAINGTGVLAPAEPVLRDSLRYISGPNPPTPGQTTRFGIYGHLDNLSGQPITNAQISIGIPAPTTVVTSIPLTAYIEGLPTTCSISTQTASLVQCTFASPVPAGQTATILFFVDLTPPAPGTFLLTGPDTAPSQTANARGSYTSPFGTIENLGPICELRVDTSTVISRATHARASAWTRAVLVEFATATQKRTQGVRDLRDGRPARPRRAHGSSARRRSRPRCRIRCCRSSTGRARARSRRPTS